MHVRGMTSTTADLETTIGEMEALAQLRHRLDLAQTNRLDELFELLQRTCNGYLDLAQAEECAFVLALWRHRRADIEAVADRTVALFGLRGRKPCSYESWIAPTFDGWFQRVLNTALSLVHDRLENSDEVWRVRSVEELLVETIPGLALRELDMLEVPGGGCLTADLMGQRSYAELEPRLDRHHLGRHYRNADLLSLGVCQRTYTEAAGACTSPAMPDAIDRVALAWAVRVEVEAELERRESEPDCDIPF